MVVEVWDHNFVLEVIRLSKLLPSHPYVVVDTEFPGFIKKTPFTATDVDRYYDVKANVESMKMIQLGITLFNDVGSVHSWQFSFSDFHPAVDVHSKESIELLEKNGMDFDRNKREGVDSRVLSGMLRKVFSDNFGIKAIRWVTFHGIYDIAYLLKFFTGGKVQLPDTLSLFAEVTGNVLGSVYDLKFIAKFCDGLQGGKLGLVGLSHLMKVGDLGGETGGGCHHQAGYDSRLTAMVLGEMMRVYHLDMGRYEGVLFGVESVRFLRRTRMVALPEVTFPARSLTLVPLPLPVAVAGRTIYDDQTTLIPPRRHHLHRLLPQPPQQNIYWIQCWDFVILTNITRVYSIL